MIDIPKKLVEEAKNTNDFTEIEKYIMNNYPLGEIIRGFAEIYVTADDAVNRPQIAVTEAEYEQIMGLFRVKGQRMMNGVVVNETRGRKRKVVRDDNETVLSDKTIFNSELED